LETQVTERPVPCSCFVNMKSKRDTQTSFDAIVIGSGMGGMTTAALLARDGLRVLILEAAVSPGGCSSSYKRKGYIFESGATTLIGFDHHQPLNELEHTLGLTIEKTPIEPSMTVHMDGHSIVRWENLEQWIREVTSVFGEASEQRTFWTRAKAVSDVVWKVSGRNRNFPPQSVKDAIKLLKNDPRDAKILPYAASSVKEVASRIGISHPGFYRFLDEQLLIASQATSTETSFLFGAPALTYTNYTNYTVRGGLIEMIRQLIDYVERQNGVFKNRSRVQSITPMLPQGVATSSNIDGSSGGNGSSGDSGGNGSSGGSGSSGSSGSNGSSGSSGSSGGNGISGYRVQTTDGSVYQAPIVVSSVPIWNMPDLTHGAMKRYFENESARYDLGWGAFTMGIVTTDTYEKSMTLHHQIHNDWRTQRDGRAQRDGRKQGDGKEDFSVFVSFSHPDDTIRAKPGTRVLNVSTHVHTKDWFVDRDTYDQNKAATEEQIVRLLERNLPGFAESERISQFSATPRTWQKWVYRKHGRVGGLPQSMNRSILDWTPNKTPFKGVYLCGDTVYPGQGIPGVALSGILARHRIQEDFYP